MKRIIFVMPNAFPTGTAMAARIRALAKLFSEIGYETDVLCEKNTDANCKMYGEIFSLDGNFSGSKKLLVLPRKYCKMLDFLLSNKKYDFIVSCSMFDRFGMVIKIAKQHCVPVILESCEWFDVKGFARGKLDIRYYQFKFAFKYQFPKADGVIAISRLLEKYYLERGLNVIRIPGIHEVYDKEFRIETRNDDKIRILFAGNIFGGKEQLSELLIAMAQTDLCGKGVILNIDGPSWDEMRKSIDAEATEALKKLGSSVICHGSVPQSEMAKICCDNDFGVFFRPNRRSSHAGFPTKLGEYLSAGTPVITNDTGDISLVIDNYKNGIVLKECTVDSIKDTLMYIVKMNSSDYKQMRQNARHSAENKLDYSCYLNEMSIFLNGLEKES